MYGANLRLPNFNLDVRLQSVLFLRLSPGLLATFFLTTGMAAAGAIGLSFSFTSPRLPSRST